MDKKQTTIKKNKFRIVMEKNKITLKMLWEISPNTSIYTWKNLWFEANRKVAGIYYDAITNYGKAHNKRWKI